MSRLWLWSCSGSCGSQNAKTNEPTDSEAGIMAKIIFLSALSPIAIAALLLAVGAVVVLVVIGIQRLTRRKDD